MPAGKWYNFICHQYYKFIIAEESLFLSITHFSQMFPGAHFHFRSLAWFLPEYRKKRSGKHPMAIWKAQIFKEDSKSIVVPFWHF